MEAGSWAAVRLAAGILLAVNLGLVAVFSHRELRFLAGVEPRERRLFVLQDILVQAAILAVLLPCLLADRLTRVGALLIVVGFTLLWLGALWTLLSRSMYTYRLMLGQRGSRQSLEDEIAALRAAGSGAAAPQDGPDA